MVGCFREVTLLGDKMQAGSGGCGRLKSLEMASSRNSEAGMGAAFVSVLMSPKVIIPLWSGKSQCRHLVREGRVRQSWVVSL